MLQIPVRGVGGANAEGQLGKGKRKSLPAW